MTLENQVCSLELAKRLKELGVGKKRGDSLFVWVMDTGTKEYKLTSFENPWYGAVTNYYAAGFDNAACPMYSAFTAAELGALLPIHANGGCLRIGKGDNKSNWFAIYEGNFIEDIDEGFLPTVKAVYADSMADALASMLIQLLEGKLITL